jgi:nuclear receptor subfamily 4 group A protein 2
VAVTVPHMVYGAPSAIASVTAPVVPTDLCPNVDTNVVIGTTRSRRASLPTQRSESAR